MTITTYFLSKLDFSIPKRWLSGKSEKTLAGTATSVWRLRSQRSAAVNSLAHIQGLSRPEPQTPKACKPLRVVHVVEHGQSTKHAGRMIISGRMADVCAELDRLAACEAA